MLCGIKVKLAAGELAFNTKTYWKKRIICLLSLSVKGEAIEGKGRVHSTVVGMTRILIL